MTDVERVHALAAELFQGRRTRTYVDPDGLEFFLIEGDVGNDAEWELSVELHRRLGSSPLVVALEGSWPEEVA